MKHSPGPWSITCERDRENAFNNIGSAAEYPQQEVALIPCSNPDYRANQRLIAKSPDLLALAAEIAESDCAQCVPGDPPCGGCVECRAREIVGEVNGG